MYLSQFLTSAPSARPVEKYYSLLKGEDLMQVHSNAFNLVVGRDLRRNVLYASTMSVELAQHGKQVLYLNTYAGEHLLRLAFESAMESPISPPDAASAAPTDVCLESLATGDWQFATVLKLLEQHQPEVLIINSFEFAAFSRYQREIVARDLIRLKEKFSLTVIVFSHEMKRDLEAHCTSRGAVGILASVAESVSKIGDEWRSTAGQPIRVLPQGGLGENPVGNRRIHEKQTLNKDRLPRKFGGTSPNPTVDILNDRGFSYHHGDFWANPFDRGPDGDYTGRGMALFARTPLLLKYFLDRPDQKFMRGNTPTEAELYARQSVGL